MVRPPNPRHALAVSEIVSSILVVVLVVVLAAVIAALVFGVIPGLKKPPITAAGVTAQPIHIKTPSACAVDQDVRIISILNQGGDTLRFTKANASTHETVKEVKFMVIPPDGRRIEPVTSVSMKPDYEWQPGETVYIFYDGHVYTESGNKMNGFWLSNDLSTRKDQCPPFYDLSRYPQQWGDAGGNQMNPLGSPAGKGSWKLQVIDVENQWLVGEVTFTVS